MRLVVQIPCLNEEATFRWCCDRSRSTIPGIDEIIVLIIDDGSTDRTVEVARAHGVTHFVRHARNRGLGRSFHDGVQRALELGADIVVNTDGDNQYPQERIAGSGGQPVIAGDGRHRHRRPPGASGRALLAAQDGAAASSAAGS